MASTSICLALVSIFIATLLWLFRYRRAIASSKSRRKLPPGPRGIPIIGNLHMLGTLPHRSLNELSKKYGPIMFLKLGNVPTVVISSPSAAELILKTHDAVFASRPKSDVVDNTTNGSKGIGFAPYGPLWRDNKKFVTQELLTAAKIESFAAMRKAEIEALVKSIRAAAEGREAVDLTSEVGKLIENVTYKMLFGCSDNSDRRHDDFKCIVEEIVSLEGAFNIVDYIPILKPFDLQGLNKRIKAVGKSIDKLFAEIIKEHEEDTKKGIPKSNKNIVDIMLSSHKLDLVSIKPLLLDMIVGSVDTSWTWIVWTLAEIMRHPRVMKRLQQELETKVGLNRMVEEKDLPNLEYLEMVIKESFRLHPVATLLLPRESMEDIELDGHFIPKKTRVLINCWAIGHDPDFWSDNNNVEEFVPERFMNKNIDLRGHDFHLLPFGYGRRACPGVNLGLIIVKLIVGQLIHCFNWELPNEMSHSELNMSEKYGLASPKADHLVVVPSHRLFSQLA
ncbi:PREDICTED: cytochrome P450 CYP736A12-like isoform X1 [Ipomoea nil]|uniref:cytochrome P450 CYP736A12-like isoform X1 n=1 Tax=Ipomoea nil TaxID=35883 RepID=UPI000901E090|nr:PREDICTED: cytochrome P450 CYP736A12-like isoform X1 [Ipomoea nil]